MIRQNGPFFKIFLPLSFSLLGLYQSDASVWEMRDKSQNPGRDEKERGNFSFPAELNFRFFSQHPPSREKNIFLPAENKLLLAYPTPSHKSQNLLIIMSGNLLKNKSSLNDLCHDLLPHIRKRFLSFSVFLRLLSRLRVAVR